MVDAVINFSLCIIIFSIPLMYVCSQVCLKFNTIYYIVFVSYQMDQMMKEYRSWIITGIPITCSLSEFWQEPWSVKFAWGSSLNMLCSPSSLFLSNRQSFPGHWDDDTKRKNKVGGKMLPPIFWQVEGVTRDGKNPASGVRRQKAVTLELGYSVMVSRDNCLWLYVDDDFHMLPGPFPDKFISSSAL